ncbi:MAG: hypothetical protein MJ217_02440 [Bacilli bacterium]|nr:hypothetical protein [Bacilli bacterium]
MFKYSKAALGIIEDDFVRFYHIFQYSFILLTIGYFTFAYFVGIGNKIIDLIFIALNALYLIYCIFIKKILSRKAKKKVKRTFNWIKIAVKAVSLGISIYAIYITSTSEIKPISIILLVLMIIFWILQVLLEIIVEIISRKIRFLESAIAEDFKKFSKPYHKVTDFFHKLKGEEPKEHLDENINESDISKLDDRIEEDKQKKKFKK